MFILSPSEAYDASLIVSTFGIIHHSKCSIETATYVLYMSTRHHRSNKKRKKQNKIIPWSHISASISRSSLLCSTIAV